MSLIIAVCLKSFQICWTDRCECRSKAGSGSGCGRLLTRRWADVFLSPRRCSWWWRWWPRLQPAHTGRQRGLDLAFTVVVLDFWSLNFKHTELKVKIKHSNLPVYRLWKGQRVWSSVSSGRKFGVVNVVRLSIKLQCTKHTCDTTKHKHWVSPETCDTLQSIPQNCDYLFYGIM